MAFLNIRALKASSCLRERKFRLLIVMAGGKFSSVSWVQRQRVIDVTPNSAQTTGSGIKLSGFGSLGGVAAASTGAVLVGKFCLVI